jgi:hypothetical protein
MAGVLFFITFEKTTPSRQTLPVFEKKFMMPLKYLWMVLLFAALLPAGVDSQITARGRTCEPPAGEGHARARRAAEYPLPGFSAAEGKPGPVVWESRGTAPPAIIPVVVHVVYQTLQDSIDQEQILSQIDVLNADFRGLNANLATVPPVFAGLAADAEINFCLATTDPAGQPTTGIVYRQTPWANIGQLFSGGGERRVHYTSLGGDDAWDPAHYFNIWVARIGGGVLGWGTRPGTTPPSEDGLVIDPRYFGTTGLAALYPPHHLGRTATHETGHYFDLLHIWGEGNDSCTDDDGVADTPVQRNPYTGCPVHPQLSCGNVAMFMNFMDYTDDACLAMFTHGQKARMWQTLQVLRPGLLESPGCGTVETHQPQPALSALTLFPNPAGDWLYVLLPGPDTDETISIRIFNAQGKSQPVNWQIQNGRVEIPLKDLEPGIYFLWVEMGNGRFGGKFFHL